MPPRIRDGLRSAVRDLNRLHVRVEPVRRHRIPACNQVGRDIGRNRRVRLAFDHRPLRQLMVKAAVLDGLLDIHGRRLLGAVGNRYTRRRDGLRGQPDAGRQGCAGVLSEDGTPRAQGNREKCGASASSDQSLTYAKR